MYIGPGCFSVVSFHTEAVEFFQLKWILKLKITAAQFLYFLATSSLTVPINIITLPVDKLNFIWLSVEIFNSNNN